MGRDGASVVWELRWGLGLRLVVSRGFGLEDSFSDSKLSSWSPKSLRSRWDVVTGLEAGDKGRVQVLGARNLPYAPLLCNIRGRSELFRARKF